MEELHIQTKYVALVGCMFERFKQQNTFLWNCRCPYCGDSDRSRTKARGYFYQDRKSGLIKFQCHNCGKAAHLKTVLKDFAQNLYNEYIFESFKSKGSSGDIGKPRVEESVLPENHWSKGLTPVSDLSKTHMVNEYLKSRKIPKDKYDRFWYTYNFKDFLESIGIYMTVPSDPRLLMLETDKFNNLKIIIARALKDSDMRYVTIKIDDAYPKVFGLGKLDYTKPIRVVEGAIDSLFIDNCVATLDSNLTSILSCDTKIKDPIFIWDNESRNIYNCRRIKKAIDAGHKVVIFPKNIVAKDINQMAQAGIDVNKMIEENTYQGIIARLNFTNWSKMNV